MKVNHNLKNSIMEAVENQLRDNNPKATRETFNKLMTLGYAEITAKEKIAAVVLENIYKMLKQKRRFDESVFSGKLAAMIAEETAKHANQGKTERIQELLNVARYYHNVAENEREAIRICDNILKEDSNNRDAMLIKAGALEHVGKSEESLRLINAIKEKWPVHWEAYYLSGLHFFNRDETKAFEFLKKSLELNENFDNLIVTAQLAYFMGKQDYQDYLDKAEKLDLERLRKYMKEGWSYDI